MKKTLLILLALLLAFTLFACSSKTEAPEVEESSSSSAEESSEPVNDIMAYIQKGYDQQYTTVGDNLLTVRFAAPDKTDFVDVSVELTEEEANALNELDFFAEDYDEQEQAIFASLSGETTVTSLNDRIPTDEELEKLVGLTFAELEEMDYCEYSVENDENDVLVMIYTLDDLAIACVPEGDYEDLFSLAEVEDIGALKIESVRFYGFV